MPGLPGAFVSLGLITIVVSGKCRARPDICGLFSGRAVFIILAVMSIAHRLTCKKLRVLSRLRRSQPAPNIRNPAPLRTLRCPCVASSSCLALGKCPQMLERTRHLRPLSSLLLTYFSAMTSCSQTCMNKLRAAPLLRALASLHTFAPRPASGAFRAFALLCAHVWALANVRKTGYASISVFAAACSLFIHTKIVSFNHGG